MQETTDATLTNIEKHRIWKLVTEYGPPPRDFQWKEREQREYHSMGYRPYRVSVLTHQPTGYYCVFGAHDITTSPGWNKKVQEFTHEDKLEKKEDLCAKWLILVK